MSFVRRKPKLVDGASPPAGMMGAPTVEGVRVLVASCREDLRQFEEHALELYRDGWAPQGPPLAWGPGGICLVLVKFGASPP